MIGKPTRSARVANLSVQDKQTVNRSFEIELHEQGEHSRNHLDVLLIFSLEELAGDEMQRYLLLQRCQAASPFRLGIDIGT
jgi:hypothetical protein